LEVSKWLHLRRSVQRGSLVDSDHSIPYGVTDATYPYKIQMNPKGFSYELV
jgi:hypothetical protein